MMKDTKDRDVTDRFEQGQLINDRYRILGMLGSGGMADVYLAEDLSLGRRVALKVLLRRFADDQTFVERFRREAKAAAGLNHPNVVGIYDWGQIDSLYYIVMEYVEGETLKDLIRRRGRLPGNEAVGITLGLLAAIDFAHQHGIVHRDIKSQNILIDRSGQVKVTDFGIARAGDSSMTEAGSILGTAQYLAPEQARGEPVDERTDLYSVGVVLYEMLTGRVPFKGDSAVTVALKHVNELPPQPQELVPGLPFSLNQIVLKALAKSPDHRYASAAEFARDLRSAQTGGPLVAAAFDAAAESTQVMRPLAVGGEGATAVLDRDEFERTRVSGPRPPGGGEREPRRRSRWPILIGILVLLLAAGAAFALYRSFAGNTKPVPSVIGLRQTDASTALKTAGFAVKAHDDYSDTVDVGFVVSQQPQPNTKLISGGTVDIYVSRGRLTIFVPDFTGKTPQYVLNFLNANGLHGRRLKGTSTTVASGEVFKQSPLVGQTLKRGGTLTYYVSAGIPQVLVPDLSGLKQADAASALTAKGLQLGNVSQQFSATVPLGEVVGQNPSAGQTVDQGSSVDIALSEGPSPSPSPSPSLVPVPNVVTMDATTATSTLNNVGFAVIIKLQGGGQQAPGTVLKQDPAADKLAPVGSTVTLTVAK
jgi:beta-lactam-binding protein with PASTA domain